MSIWRESAIFHLAVKRWTNLDGNSGRIGFAAAAAAAAVAVATAAAAAAGAMIAAATTVVARVAARVGPPPTTQDQTRWIPSLAAAPPDGCGEGAMRLLAPP